MDTDGEDAEKRLSPERYFDVSGMPLAGLLEGVRYAWEIVPRIREVLAGFDGWRIEGEVARGAHVEGKVRMGRGSVVEPGAFIQGPAYIGEGAVIRHGAYVRGDVIVGDECVVGHATEVKNSVFLRGAKAAHFAYVGDSVLGAGVNLGAGTKLANFKFRAGGSEVVVRIGGRDFPTGLRKLGAILGDGVEFGCNCVAAPGTLVGKNSLVYAGASVSGVIPGNSIIKLKQTLHAVKRL
ncbi:MAG: glucose-1-phosphate thymidylyltransferase [bacterium]